MSEERALVVLAMGAIALIIGSIGGCMRYYPEYSVWQSKLAGEAELARASQNRQIRVQESQAKLDSAKLDAEAEVARAKGSAQANEIMAKSLAGEEADRYLRLRWIMMMEEHKDVPTQLIYLPNDSLPIAEAGRAIASSVAKPAPAKQETRNGN